MANDIEIVVSGTNKTTAAFSAVNRGVAGMRRGAAAAWREFDVLAMAAELATEEIRALGRALDGIGVERVRQVRGELRGVGQEATVAAGAVSGIGRDGGLDEAASSSERISESLGDAAEAAEEAADGADGLGDGLGEGSRRARSLADEVDAARARVDDLLGRIARTGDVDLLKGLRVERSSLAELERVTRDVDRMGRTGLSGMGQGMVSGMVAGLSGLPSVVGRTFAATGPIGLVVAGGIAAAASIGLASGLAATGIMAGAAGGIAAGIAGAAQDPMIKQAGADIKQTFLDELGDIGFSFVGPIIRATKTIKDELGALRLEDAFRPLAHLINPIVDGLFAMAQKAMPGISQMIKAAQPLVLQLVDDLPGLGESIGDFAESLAEAGPGAAKFFHQLITWVGGALEVIGDLIEGGAKIYDFFAEIGEAIGIFDFGDSAKTAELFGDSTSGAIYDIAESADEANSKLLTLQQTFDAMSGKAISTIEATSAYEAAIDAATDALAENGRTLDLGTEKGRANQQALLGIVSSSQALAQATFDQTAATQGETAAQEAAAAVWSRGREQLISLATQMGMSAAQANALANQIMGIPNFRNVRVSVDISAAEAALNRIRNQINSLGRSIGPGEAASYYGQMMGVPRERGGPVRAGEAYVVGERRPELFIPTQNGMIYPEVPDTGPLATWSPPGPQATQPAAISITVQAGLITTPDEVAATIAALLRQHVKATGPMPELVGSTS